MSEIAYVIFACTLQSDPLWLSAINGCCHLLIASCMEVVRKCCMVLASSNELIVWKEHVIYCMTHQVACEYCSCESLWG